MVSLGDTVRPPCLVLDGTAFDTMSCSVYNSTNTVGVRYSASECHISFTAEMLGPVEMTCHVQCTQEVTTFNISWTVVGKYIVILCVDIHSLASATSTHN